MPRGDGTGPVGQGPGTDRGQGGRQGRGRGNRPGAGPEGQCVCPDCGEKTPHQAGVPCYQVKCSKCGQHMIRE